GSRPGSPGSSRSVLLTDHIEQLVERGEERRGRLTHVVAEPATAEDLLGREVVERRAGRGLGQRLPPAPAPGRDLHEPGPAGGARGGRAVGGAGGADRAGAGRAARRPGGGPPATLRGGAPPPPPPRQKPRDRAPGASAAARRARRARALRRRGRAAARPCAGR